MKFIFWVTLVIGIWSLLGKGVYINNNLRLAWKYARIFVHGHICGKKQTVFRECSSRKTVSSEKQIMSKDKYPGIFLHQMEAIVFIILLVFFATHTVEKIGEYSQIFPSLSWGIFGHMTCLDQSCASKNIWWIINHYIWDDNPVYKFTLQNCLCWKALCKESRVPMMLCRRNDLWTMLQSLLPVLVCQDSWVMNSQKGS